jgi:hypothetical protein
MYSPGPRRRRSCGGSLEREGVWRLGDTANNRIQARSAGLEGSRFGALPVDLPIFVKSRVRPENVQAGGSRELPNAMMHHRFLDSFSARPVELHSAGLFAGAAC